MKALRSFLRVYAVAHSTLRDLGLRCSALFVLVILVTLAASWRPVSSADLEREVARTVQMRVETLLFGAALATLVAGTISVSEDRRSRRLVGWLSSPLSPLEYVTGKFGGVLVGSTLVFAPLLLLSVGVLPGGIAARSEAFQRPYRVLPTTGFDAQRGGVHAFQSSIFLDSGAAVVLKFDRAARRGPRQTLRVSLLGSALVSGEPDQPPRLSVGGGEPGEGVVLRRHVLERGDQVIEFDSPEKLPFWILLDAGRFHPDASLVIGRESFALIGDPRSITDLLLRLLFGLGGSLVLVAALGCALGAALPDVLALGVGAVLLGLGAMRETLRDVALQVAHFSEDTSSLTRITAEASAELLRGVPDVQELWGTKALLRESSAFSGEQYGTLGQTTVIGVVSMVFAWQLLARLKRWQP